MRVACAYAQARPHVTESACKQARTAINPLQATCQWGQPIKCTKAAQGFRAAIHQRICDEGARWTPLPAAPAALLKVFFAARHTSTGTWSRFGTSSWSSSSAPSSPLSSSATPRSRPSQPINGPGPSPSRPPKSKPPCPESPFFPLILSLSTCSPQSRTVTEHVRETATAAYRLQLPAGYSRIQATAAYRRHPPTDNSRLQAAY
jgi:hypothetical protein